MLMWDFITLPAAVIRWEHEGTEEGTQDEEDELVMNAKKSFCGEFSRYRNGAYSRKNQNGRKFRRQNQSGKQPGRQNQCGRPELRRTENYILGTIADLRHFDERFRVL